MYIPCSTGESDWPWLSPEWDDDAAFSYLCPDMAHVWIHDTESCGRESEDLLSTAWLSPEEEKRCEAITCEHRRKQTRLSCSLRRLVLGRHLGVPPAELEYCLGQNGKPLLADTHPLGPELHFSLSHTGTTIALVVSALPVGVDVEVQRDPVDYPGIVRRLFPESWARQLHELAHEPARRSAYFTRCWTCIEAEAKMTGRGVTRKRNVLSQSVWGYHAQLPSGLIMALAFSGQPSIIRFFNASYLLAVANGGSVVPM